MTISWANLHQKHHAQAIRVAVSILCTGLVREYAAVAEDVVQDAWITAWKLAKDEDHARALLFRCTKLGALDRLRTAKRRENLDAQLIYNSRDTVNPGWGAQANPILVRAVHVLTDGAFETWYLKDVCGMRLLDVCHERKLKFAAMNGQLSRARNTLKREDTK
jgi:DNA-directed RNA polymerase specialized sigma24 family protein